MKTYLLLPHLRIHKVNAASSLYTVGFPAMTAWMGAVHALERRLREKGFSHVTLQKVGISCHSFELQSQGSGRGRRLTDSLNPATKDPSKPPSIIQSPKAHMEVSLLIECDGMSAYDKTGVEEAVKEILPRMKFAGGDLMNAPDRLYPKIYEVDPLSLSDGRRLLRRMMLGNVLVERRGMLQEYMRGANCKSVMGALLDHLAVDTERTVGGDGEASVKREKRVPGGWFVPIMVGFRDLSGKTTGNQRRDETQEHHFVEPLITLGEFLLPIRIEKIDDMMWSYDYDAKNGYYRCVNEKF